MSSKKKRSRSSALSSPYVSRLPSTDRRLSRAAGTTAVAAERSDPARDMGLQPAGPDVPTSSVCWCGVATNSLVAHVRTWNDCYGFDYTSGYCPRKFGVLLWHPCPARTRFRGVDAMGGGRCILENSAWFRHLFRHWCPSMRPSQRWKEIYRDRNRASDPDGRRLLCSIDSGSMHTDRVTGSRRHPSNDRLARNPVAGTHVPAPSLAARSIDRSTVDRASKQAGKQRGRQRRQKRKPL